MVPNISTVLKGIFVGSLGMMLGGLIAIKYYRSHPQNSANVSQPAPIVKEETGCAESSKLIRINILNDKDVTCKPGMFLENVELENGNILVICRCSDTFSNH